MAGSADIRGTQNYVMGIGHPKTETTTEAPPAMVVTDPLTGVIGLTGPEGKQIPTLQDGIYNYSPSFYRKSRAAFSKVRAGVSNATIVRIGDSTEAGKGAPTFGSVVASRASNPSVRLTALLNSPSLPFRANTFTCEHGVGDIPTLKLYDPRIATTGATNVWNGSGTLTKACFRFPNAASTITLTADQACDTWEFTYLDSSTAAFSWQIGGGGATTVTQTNTSSLVKVTASGTAATTFTLTWIGGTVGILHVKAYNASAKEVSVLGAGVLGADSGFFASATNYYSALNHLKNIAPDLTTIRLGINDWNPATPISTAAYSANIQALITAAKLSGDVILVTPNPTQETGTMTLAGQSAYIKVLYALAEANQIALVDVWSRFSSYADSSSTFYSDSEHLNIAGYADIAKAESELIRKL